MIQSVVLTMPAPALLRPFSGLLLLVLLSGCSIGMASRQPPAKDLTKLNPGTPRAQVLAEFGAPQGSEVAANRVRIDHFVFVQGYSQAARTSRARLHGAADTVTLGLWELIGTPTEMIFDGSELQADVTYEPDRDVVRTSVVRKK